MTARPLIAWTVRLVVVALAAVGITAVTWSAVAPTAKADAAPVGCSVEGLRAAIAAAPALITLTPGCTYTVPGPLAADPTYSTVGYDPAYGTNYADYNAFPPLRSVIEGSGDTVTTAAATSNVRLFYIPADVSLSGVSAPGHALSDLTHPALLDLTVTGVSTPTLGGAGLYAAGGFTLEDDTFSNLSAGTAASGKQGADGLLSTGGAIAATGNDDNSWVYYSTFSDDTGLQAGGLSADPARVTVTSSTFYRNATPTTSDAAARDLYDAPTLSTITAIGDTFGGPGAGLPDSPSIAGSASLQGSILVSADCTTQPGVGALTDAGENISWDPGSTGGNNGTGCPGAGAGNPRLGEFGAHGGPTSTIPLSAPSSAIDHYTSCKPDLVDNTDQRGVARPQGTACDSGAYESVQQPTITSLTTDDGSALTTWSVLGGITVTVTGSGVGKSSTVLVDGAPQPTTVDRDLAQSVTFVLPPHAEGEVPVTVRTDDGDGDAVTSDPVPLAYTGRPSITSVSATTGVAGDVVTVTGYGFEPDQSDSGCVGFSFGGSEATVTAVTDTHATLTVPPGTGAVDLTAQTCLPTGNPTSAPQTFTYLAPTITSMLPAQTTLVGGQVTITGANFNACSAVDFGGQMIRPDSQTSTQIVFTAPLASQSGPVSVGVNNCSSESAASTFTYEALRITGVSPGDAPTAGGAVLTISGTGFGTAGSVTINGHVATLAGAGRTDTSISVIAPAGDPGPATVTVSDRAAGGGQDPTVTTTVAFRYDDPSIDSVSPGSLYIGDESSTPITITGSDFGTDSGFVEIGHRLASVVSWSDHRVQASASGFGAGTYDVTVAGAGGDSTTASSALVVTASASVVQVTPSHLPTTGGQITVTGSGFGAPGQVTINGQPATVETWTASTISAIAPPGEPGPTTLVVAPTDGQGGSDPRAAYSSTTAFSYDLPSVASVSPTSLKTTDIQPALVTINGANFGPQQGSVEINGVPASFSDPRASWGSTQITALLPPLTADGSYSVDVIAANGLSVLDRGAITFTEVPTLVSITPSHLPTTGGTITISGSGLGSDGAIGQDIVMVGDQQARVTGGNDDSLQVVVPPGEPGETTVSVTHDGQPSTNTLPFSYDLPSITSVSPAVVASTDTQPALITILGSNFGPNPGSVLVNGAPATLLAPGGAWLSTEIDVVAPVLTKDGSYDVQVITASGPSVTDPGAISFADNSLLLTVAPNDLPTTGGVVTITGRGFEPGYDTVVVGGIPATSAPGTESSTVLHVTIPPGEPGPAPLSLVNSVTGRSSNADPFSYDDPVITAVSPQTINSPDTTNQLLTIDGTDFGTQPGSVEINGSFASLTAPGTKWSDKQIIVGLPKLGPGSYQILLVANRDPAGGLFYLTVTDTPTSTTGLSVDVSHPVTGQPVTFTATVAGQNGPPTAAPGGSVEFSWGGTDLPGCAAVPVSNGTAQCTVPDGFAAGAVSVSAAFSGDSTFPASNATPLPVQVTPAATTTVLAPDNNPAVTGQALTLTATVSVTSPGSPGAATASGTVAFQSGGISLAGCGAVAIDDTGTATCTVAAGFTPSKPSLVAVYSGDTNFGGSRSAALSEEVDAAATTVSVVSAPNPPTAGQAVTFTATVAPLTPATGTPTGTATFTVSGPRSTALTCTAGNAVQLSSTATASCAIPASKVVAGSYAVTVAYGGDTSYLAGSGSLSQTASRGTAMVTVTSSANPATPQSRLTLTATVTAKSPASGIPSGTVTFAVIGQHGPPVFCAGFNTVRLSAGVAKCIIATGVLRTANGPYTVVAWYSGSPTLTAATGKLSEQVSKASTTVKVIALPVRFSPALPTTFAASVTTSPGSRLPIGGAIGFTVTGANGKPVACPVIGPIEWWQPAGFARIAWCTVKRGGLLATGGPYSVVATYAGDGNVAGSSAALSYVTSGR